MVPTVIGVVGAGTMGAGIAQLAAQTGARTLVHDASAEALERGLAGLRERLDRAVERGRVARAELGAVEPAAGLEDLAGAELIVEAAPEDLELKRRLFRDLAEVAGDGCVLATNTCSLSVTALQAGV